ncbi:EamA family transporter [Pseudonocardia sp. Cha107L01]|uniref:EamA family transporter n=1 Tax=Pseudonocardia sp. Cha107L01 TaxID=3457576 RepID=UPI00403E9AB2
MTESRPAVPTAVPSPVPASVPIVVPAADTGRTGSRGGGAGAVGLVLGGALSVQFGAAVAALLFPRAGVSGVVTLRLVIAAAVLLAVCRPRPRGYGRRDWLLIGGFGTALAGMNTLIYEAIDRIPLGAAVTLEVLGPLALSVIAGGRPTRWLWGLLALCGVVLLQGGGVHGLDLGGVGFALGASVMWAAYILLSARTGRRFPRADGLALAMTAAAVLTLPLGVATAGSALFDPVTLGLGAAVAGLSSVLPYTLELLALRRMPTSTFAVLVSLGPAIAAVAGLLVLGQSLAAGQVAAIVLVVAASAGAVRTSAADLPR